MQNVLAFADHLEAFAQSEALLGQAEHTSLSPSLVIAVRRLILEGTSLPGGKEVPRFLTLLRAAMPLPEDKGVVGISNALRAAILEEGEGVPGISNAVGVAMWALRDLDRWGSTMHRDSNPHRIFGPRSRSAPEWADYFRRIAQRMRAAVEAAADAGAADPVTVIYRERKAAGLTEPSQRAEAEVIRRQWVRRKATLGRPVLSADTIRRRLPALGHSGARRVPQSRPTHPTSPDGRS
jgi:hypothetical protein